MIHVVARIQARPGKGRALREAFSLLLPQVLAEVGCIRYVPTVDAASGIERQAHANVDAVTIVEQWETLEHLKAHLKASHMIAFRTNVGALIESTDLRILEEATG